jgi:hypothetical protein
MRFLEDARACFGRLRSDAKDIKSKSLGFDDTASILGSLQSMSYVPDSVCKEVIDGRWRAVRVTMSKGRREATLTALVPEEASQDVNQMWQLLWAVSGYLHERVSKRDRVHAVYVGCSCRRKLPTTPGEPLDKEHVNGGVTSFHPDGTPESIIVFRREDACKVLVHELLHFFGVGYELRQRLSGSQAESRILRAFGVECYGPDRGGVGHAALDEGLVDYLACQLEAAWRCVYDGHELGRALTDVYDHTVCRAARTLVHHLVTTDADGAVHMPERSHAFAYYIVKAALFMNPTCVDETPALFVADRARHPAWTRNPDDFADVIFNGLGRWRVDGETIRRALTGSSLCMTPWERLP